MPSHAIDYGPFTLTGFAKSEWGQGNSRCSNLNCGLYPNENKQRSWADEVVPGTPYGGESSHVFLFEPWLTANFDLGHGFKLSGMVSQRWRDGKEDVPGYIFEQNVALSHEDYGSLRIGAMTTRTWSIADYPYGTNLGFADFWGASGAGYGLLTNAVRFTSRPLDVAEGDLVLEATYDGGNSQFSIHKPRFLELYAQYHRGDLVIDSMLQDTRNGTPMAWSHGPFKALSNNPADDAKLGGSGQGLLMLMARYQVNSKIEVSGGLRRNYWSGAYAVQTQAAAYNYLGVQTQPGLWNDMFNVDWNAAGSTKPGYSATSNDFMLGARYRLDEQWVASAGVAHLGKASTANPSERGQSNAATMTSASLNYDFGHGLQFYVALANVRYDKLGLSPMSMPGNSAFTNVDSRVAKTGSWFVLGSVFVF